MTDEQRVVRVLWWLEGLWRGTVFAWDESELARKEIVERIRIAVGRCRRFRESECGMLISCSAGCRDCVLDVEIRRMNKVHGDMINFAVDKREEITEIDRHFRALTDSGVSDSGYVTLDSVDGGVRHIVFKRENEMDTLGYLP